MLMLVVLRPRLRRMSGRACCSRAVYLNERKEGRRRRRDDDEEQKEKG